MEPLHRAKAIDTPSGPTGYEQKEMWLNELYTVIVNRHIQVPAIVSDKNQPLTLCWLSIRRNDRQPITDWRHLQWIKNQLVGEECEGCELFPAESRLVDGANQYHLWVAEDSSFRFPFGFDERLVTEKIFFENMEQRPFPQDRKPADLEACETKVNAQICLLQSSQLGKEQQSS